MSFYEYDESILLRLKLQLMHSNANEARVNLTVAVVNQGRVVLCRSANHQLICRGDDRIFTCGTLSSFFDEAKGFVLNDTATSECCINAALPDLDPCAKLVPRWSLDLSPFAADVTLIADNGEEIPAHRIVLAARAPMLLALADSSIDNTVAIAASPQVTRALLR